MAYHLIRRLYESSTMVDAPIGLYAFIIAQFASAPTPIASIIKRATPFEAIEDEDWAFYAALAVIKHADQPQLAMRFLELAKLVPHHHPSFIKVTEAEIAQKWRLSALEDMDPSF